MKKHFHIGLLPRILIAIVLGILFGMFTHDWVARFVATFNYLFSQYLSFLVPLIIIAFVTPAISDIGAKAGKMLLATTLLAYVATVLSGTFSYVCSSSFFPHIITASSTTLVENSDSIKPWFKLDIPPLCGVTSALVLAFLLGLCIAYLQGETMKKFFHEFRDIMEMVIRRSLIPILPLYIFGIFHNMTVEGQVFLVLQTFFKIILFIFILHIVLLLAQYCVAAMFSHRNPLKMLRTMLPAYFTALGTQSSAATIPVTLRQSLKMGVDESVASFVIPLCATIHLSGSTLKIVACALAIMIMENIPYDLGLMMGFIAMLAITMVAAPGIPGGAIMASLGVLQMILGFSESQCALMIALYIAMDSFGTACNVTGDGAIAIIINRFFSSKK